MRVREIYSKIVNHQIKGLMVHEQLAEYYDFLGLAGYKRCHEYHYFNECISYRKTIRYFINHHNKLVPNIEVNNPKIIPESWYKYSRHDVDVSTKRNAIKNGIEVWKSWETETKELYQEMFNELCEIGEVASANFVNELIQDVDCELKYVERYCLNLKAIDYDMSIIIPEQDCTHEKYRKMMENFNVKY